MSVLLGCGAVPRGPGLASHAAVVARDMDKCAVTGVGASGLVVDEHAGTLYSRSTSVEEGQRVLHKGDVVTLDGFSGRVYEGVVPSSARQDVDFLKMMSWLYQYRSMRVVVSVDRMEDAYRVRALLVLRL